MSTRKIELSVGAVKYVDPNEIITEEEYNYIKNKVPELNGRVGDIENEIDEINSSLDNIENEKATRQEVDVERKRIDNFTNLTEGSTTGDAELIDGRIGADGTVYSNIGSAIRSQIKNGSAIAHKLVSEYVPFMYEKNFDVTSTAVGSSKVIADSVQIGKKYLIISDNKEKISKFGLMNKSYTWEAVINATTYNEIKYAILTPTANTLNISVIYSDNITSPFSHNIKIYDVDEINDIQNHIAKICDKTSYNIEDLKELSKKAAILVNPFDVIFDKQITITNSDYNSFEFSKLLKPNKKYLVVTTSSNISKIGLLNKSYTWEEYKNVYKYNFIRYVELDTTENSMDIVVVSSGVTTSETADLVVFDISNFGLQLSQKNILDAYISRDKGYNVFDLKSESEVKNKWKDKTWISLGDSITAPGIYQNFVRNELEFKTVLNKGIAGQPLASFTDNVTDEEFESADLITLYGALNNMYPNAPSLGNITDEPQKTGSTFISNLKYQIEYILSKKPTITLVIIGTHNAWDSYRPNIYQPIRDGKNIGDYVKGMGEVARMYGLHFIDMYAESGLNALTMSNYSEDNCHLNELGYEKKIAPVIINHLKIIQ